MKKAFLLIFTVFFLKTVSSQTKDTTSKFNFNFEKIVNSTPIGWSSFGGSNYTLGIDSNIVKNGKYAVKIASKEGITDYKAWEYIMPNSYVGKKITLTGYIKTENVTDGYAGLWMRIDPAIAFDNMEKMGIKGTTDWKKYEITLNLNPVNTKQIVFGGLIVGKGKMWLDDLNISIDGKNLETLIPIQKKEYPADKDKTFDSSSKINNIEINNTQTENLYQLGLIWGFLKYYHPNIAKGNFNWDFELFRILPKILNLYNNVSRDSVLVKWINSLGVFDVGKEFVYKPSITKIKPDLDWITSSNFSNELSNLLISVKNAKRTNEHYYIGILINSNPEFKNENPYSSLKYPDAGYRILTLYRYWNIIQYYFPDKHLIGSDWKTILKEFIPKLINAKDETAYALSTLELIGKINATHANVWGGRNALETYFGLRFAPVELTFVENQPIVTFYYDKKLGKETGLEIGDQITTINNKTIGEIIKEKIKYYPGSNYETKLRDIAYDLLRTNDTIIYLEYIRNDKKESRTIKTYNTKEIDIYSKYNEIDTCFKLINNDIAYINNGSLKKKYLYSIWKAMKNTKGLIIDIRNYPSDFPIFDLAKYLMPKSTPFVKYTVCNIKIPGLFTFTMNNNIGRNNKEYYKGKVVILVNEYSQSSAEYHAMAYRVNPNAIVIGSTTAGADGDVSRFYLPGGLRSMISGIGILYPDGKETQRIGIVPDIECKPTIKGVKNGRDEMLEKAIEIINQ